MKVRVLVDLHPGSAEVYVRGERLLDSDEEKAVGRIIERAVRGRVSP